MARGTYIYPPAALDAAGHRHLLLLRRAPAGVEHHLHLRLPHPRGRLDGGPGDRLHPRQRHRLRRGGAGRRSRRRRLRPAAELLLERPQQPLRGGGQVPGGPADVGQDHDRAVRGQGRAVDPAALPHPDRRVDADRPAAREQHRPGHHPGPGRRPRGNPEPPHQRLRRGPRAAHRAGGQDRPPDPADRRLRVRHRRHRRPAGRLVVRRVADRRGGDGAPGSTSSGSTPWVVRSTPSRPSTCSRRSSRPPTPTPRPSTAGEKVVVGVNRFVDEQARADRGVPDRRRAAAVPGGPGASGAGRAGPGRRGRRPGGRGGGGPGHAEPARPDEGGALPDGDLGRGVRRAARASSGSSTRTGEWLDHLPPEHPEFRWSAQSPARSSSFVPSASLTMVSPVSDRIAVRRVHAIAEGLPPPILSLVCRGTVRVRRKESLPSICSRRLTRRTPSKAHVPPTATEGASATSRSLPVSTAAATGTLRPWGDPDTCPAEPFWAVPWLAPQPLGLLRAAPVPRSRPVRSHEGRRGQARSPIHTLRPAATSSLKSPPSSH